MRKLSFAFLFMFLAASCNNTMDQEQLDKLPGQEAIEKVSKQIEKNPKDASLYFQRGVLLRKSNQDSLALVDLIKASKLDSTKANYYSAIGDLLFEKKDISGSVPWFQKAILLNPQDELAHLKIANMFFYMKDYPKAFNEINTVLRQNVYNAEAYFLKGMCYKDMGDTAHALSSFQTAVQTDPNFYNALMQLGLLNEAKKDDLAVKYYERAIKVDTLNMEPYYAQAMYYQNKNNFSEAKNVFRRALRINKDFALANYNTGWMLLQEDSAEKAYRSFDRAIQTKPDYAEAYYNRGLCSEIMNKPEEARADYEQSLVFDPENKLVLNALNRVKSK